MVRKLMILTVLIAAVLPLQAAEYSIDAAHSDASFQVRHLVSDVRGQFDQFEGTIHLDPAHLDKASVEVTIQAASINTFNEDRDKHLRSEDFFAVEKHPTITFSGKKFEKAGDDEYHVAGQLTMHGVSKDVTLPVTYLGEAKDPWGNTKAGFKTEITLNRKDYGINWNKALDQGGFILGEDVKVQINLETAKK